MVFSDPSDMPPKKKGDKPGKGKGASSIVDPVQRQQLAQQEHNHFEVDLSDQEFVNTPELLEVVEIIYHDRKKDFAGWLSKTQPHKVRLFLKTAFPRKSANTSEVVYWWKACHYAARFNRSELLTEIQKQGIDIYCQDGLGRTALHYACEYHHADMVKFIVPRARYLIGIPDMLGMTPLMHVCQGTKAVHVELCRLLISYDGDVSPTQRFGYSALMYAVKSGSEENVKSLLGAGAELDTKDRELWSALHLAAYYGHDQIASLLVVQGADIEAQNRQGATPLSLAAQQGKTGVVSVLIARGANVNCMDYQAYTPLMLAAQKGHLTVVNALLNTGNVDATAVQEDGFDALMLAVQRKHAEVAKAIAERAQPVTTAKDVRYGNNALTLAARTGNSSLISTLISKVGFEADQLNDFGVSPLLYAAESGDAATVKKLLECGADKNERRIDSYWTGTMVAAWLGHVDACRCFLEFGADPNLRAYNGMMALHLAAYQANDKVVELLLKVPKIRINARDDKGFTAIHLAVQMSRLSTVQILLNAGANPGIWEMKGEYLPIHTAAMNNDKAMINLLVKGGADIDGRQVNGRSAVMFAVMGDNDELLQHIVNRCRGDLNVNDFTGNTALSLAVDNDAQKCFRHILGVSNQLALHMGVTEVKTGFTPLMKAVIQRRNNMVRELLESGRVHNRQPVNMQDRWGRTPLYAASELQDVELMMLLLAHAADPGIANGEGKTCLGTLIGKGNVEALRVLLGRGTSILNVRDPSINGQTPLIQSIVNDDDITLEVLLEQGGTILDLSDFDGKTALIFAIEMGKVGIVERLLKLGADSNIADKKGMTPMHVACKLADKAVVQMLAEREASVTTLDAASNTPLHLLVQTASRPETANSARHKDVSVGSSEVEFDDRIEACVRLIAKIYNNAAAKKEEEEANAKAGSKQRPRNILDTQDGMGNTMLHFLVGCPKPNLRFINLLTTLGASPSVKNRAGHNVLDSVFAVSKLVTAVAQLIETKWRKVCKLLMDKAGYSYDKVDAEISMIEYSNYGLESQQAQMMLERWIARCQESSDGTSLGLREIADVGDEVGIGAVRQYIQRFTAGKKPVFRDSVINAIDSVLKREATNLENNKQ